MNPSATGADEWSGDGTDRAVTELESRPAGQLERILEI